MDVLVISISISSYQVVNRVRKNVKIVVKARILPINYQIWPRIKEMNMMQEIIYDRKYDIFDRFFSIFGYFNLVYSAWRYLQDSEETPFIRFLIYDQLYKILKAPRNLFNNRIFIFSLPKPSSTPSAKKEMYFNLERTSITKICIF